MPADTDFAEGDQDGPTIAVSEGAVGIDPRFGTDDGGKLAQDRGE